MFSLCLCVCFCLSLHQVLSYIAKGSFGPILKVKDKIKQKTYAVKVSSLPQPHIVNFFFATFLKSCQFKTAEDRHAKGYRLESNPSHCGKDF